MFCKHAQLNGRGKIQCPLSRKGTCYFQYYCGDDLCYKSTATPDKCDMYEEAELQTKQTEENK